MPELKHVYEVYIQATPERLWRALTDPAETARYYYDATIESSWKVGEPLNYRKPDGELMIEGELLETGQSLEMTLPPPEPVEA